MNLTDPVDKSTLRYAKSITGIYSKSFAVSTRFLPEKKRWATYAIYGFCRYVDNLIDVPRERTSEELYKEAEAIKEELRIGYRTGESEHPVIRAFLLAAKEYNIPLEYPLDLIKGVQMDLVSERYKTFDDLYLFCYRVAGVVGIMMTHILGTNSKEAFHFAEKLGIGMQLTNILRDIQEDKEMGRVYLPKNELEAFGLSYEDIINENFSEDFRKLMEFQIKRAHKYYSEAESGIMLLSKKSRYAIYTASRIYRGILNKIEANDYNPFLGRVYVSNSKKIRILVKELFFSRILEKEERKLPVSTANVNFANENIN